MKRFEQAFIHKPVSITYPIYQNIAQTTSAELLYRTSKPNALVSLYKKPGEIERIRKNALSLLNACHTFDARWPAVKEFLELDDL